MTIGERIKYIRINKLNGISQKEFGEKLGVTRDVINNIENDRLKKPELKESLYRLICKEFNIDYYWLTEGIGEMELCTVESIVDELVAEKGLNENSKKIILAYLEMNDTERKVIENYFINIAKKLKGE